MLTVSVFKSHHSVFGKKKKKEKKRRRSTEITNSEKTHCKQAHRGKCLHRKKKR